MPNIFQPHFDDPRDAPGFQARRARIGRQAGSRRLGASLWQVAPGQAAYPYHLHLGEEELVIVLEGRPWLRSPEGWRRLAPGDVVAFPAGEEGAHQVVNRDDGPVTFLAVSTQEGPEIVLYPDSRKVGVYERRPDGGGLAVMFRQADAVPYMSGESPPDVPG